MRSEIDLDSRSRGVPEGQSGVRPRARAAGRGLANFEQAASCPARFDDLAGEGPAKPSTPKWLIARTREVRQSTGGATFDQQDDGSYLVSGKNARTTCTRSSCQRRPASDHGVRLEALADPSLPKNGPGPGRNGNFALVRFPAVSRADGHGAAPVRRSSSPIRKPRSSRRTCRLLRRSTTTRQRAWAVDPRVRQGSRGRFEFETPLSISSRHDPHVHR